MTSTSTSKEVPYEDYELTIKTPNKAKTKPSSEVASGNENIKDELPQLALVPLHPACKKQKLEAKPLPIVLGRTNLASWWWKSCPCQHYCRLHCRPVAQNIRSLSKVMIQIDTAGGVHAVGKNPHLVTITPERGDNALQVNDILSIGRRDREPWMRLQVVRKPDIGKHLPPGKQKTHTPEWMTKQTSRSSNNHANVRSSTAKASAAPNNPPEWITTTRKRKSSSSSNRGSNTKQPQRAQPASEKLQKAYANGSNLDSESNVPSRRRRRTRETNDNKSSRQRSRNDARKLNEEFNAAPVEKDRHPQVHLVFQDYETSATLVRATQRKKKRKSNGNGDGDGAMGSNDDNKGGQAPRPFVADKTQLRLLSRNFAAALLGAVAPANDQISNQRPSQNVPVPADSSENYQRQRSQETSLNAESVGNAFIPNASSTDLGERQSGPVTNITEATHGNTELLQSVNESGTLEGKRKDRQDGEAKPVDGGKLTTTGASEASTLASNTNRRDAQQEASMLSLPQCEASSFEPSQEDVLREESKKQESKKSKANFSDESECSPASRDPVADLEPWREIIQQEQLKGNTSSVRHAFASLVVAKNKTREDNDKGLLWLPSLLEDDFYLEAPDES